MSRDSFDPPESEGVQSPIATVAHKGPEACQTAPDSAVSEVRLSDCERECAIALVASQMQHYMAEYEKHGVLSDHAAAERCRERMYELIRGRSPEQVRRLEEMRGLNPAARAAESA